MKSQPGGEGSQPSQGRTPENLFSQAYEWQQEGRFHKAIQAYQEFLGLRPKDPAAYNNMGNCLRSIGENEEAIPFFENALRLEPGRVSSRLNLSLARLAIGKYQEAWPDYEARLETISFRQDLLQHREREWKGEELGEGQILYVFGNQGLGDELQCLRFLPEAFSRAGKVILELQSPTASLLSGLPSHVTLLERGDEVPPFHRWCEIFSLPGLFGITENTIPRTEVPSFPRDSRIAGLLDAARQKNPNLLQVGLVWSGNPENSLNRFRACGLGHLLPLLDLDFCQFFSLQKGTPSRDIEIHGAGDSIVDLALHLSDFAATATAIEDLDLLITTDTSIPHLAGVLNQESWVLLHRPADWRWGMEGEKTPWYPSLRLYRQEQMREWKPVVEKVKNDLLGIRR